MLGAVTAVASSIVVARLFGTGSDIAVYFGASTLVSLMVSLTQAGQLGEVFLPEFIRLKEETGRQSAISIVWLL